MEIMGLLVLAGLFGGTVVIALALIMLYSLQKWVYLCCMELRRMNGDTIPKAVPKPRKPTRREVEAERLRDTASQALSMTYPEAKPREPSSRMVDKVLAADARRATKNPGRA